MHNILSDPLESESFYLVHARWVLCHLTEPEKALQKMVDALGPGGWLFIEEPDHESTLTSQFTETSQELVFNVSRAVFDHLKKSGVFDAYFGRKLRQLIENLSLEEVSHNGWTRLYRGGEPISEFNQMNSQLLEKAYVDSGICTQDQFEEIIHVMGDPTLTWIDRIAFGAWGRKPKN